MPKGKKTCPKCNLETGARASTCECGHQFSGSIKTVEKPKVEVLSPTPTPIPTSAPSNQPISFRDSPLVYAAAGPCPVKPQGYQKGWPEGQASEEVIVDWIYKVLASSKKNYSPHAIIYWAGQFWDVNGPNIGEDYKRVRSIIINTLVPDDNAKLEFLL